MPSRPVIKFILLNILRFLSLISLLFVLIANLIMFVEDVKAIQAEKAGHNKDNEDCDYLEKSGVPNQPAGDFRACLSLVLNIIQCIVFMFSEIDFKKALFAKIVPVLGEDRLVALGVLQILLAAQMLSHFLEPFPLVASFFLLVAGVLNTLTFRVEDPRSGRAWGVWREHKNSLPPSSRFPSYANSEKGFARHGSQQSHAVSSPARAIVGRNISRTPPQYTSSIHSGDPFTSDEKYVARYV